MYLSVQSLTGQVLTDSYGALIRSDTSKPHIYLCFTGHDFYEGFEHVQMVLGRQQIKGSFFLTGDFIRNHRHLVLQLASVGHYIGAHSDRHLLYCDWSKRDSLLHSPVDIQQDIADNLEALSDIGIYPPYFMPPYEWYNREIVQIAEALGQVVVNFSPGTRSNADYTTPDMANYRSSEEILRSIYQYERKSGLNGFHLLIHPGTDPRRKDKLYQHLERLIHDLQAQGYRFVRF